MNDTRTNIIDAAELLIRTKGYHAFSYKDISEPLKIKNAAVHYHFPTKGDLGTAVVNLTRAKFQSEIIRWASLGYREQLERFIGIYEQSESSDLVCFMGALGHTYATLPQPMQAAMTAASDDIRKWLNTNLILGKAQNEYKFAETSEERADAIITSLMASLILNRVTGEEILTNVKNAILKSLTK